MEKRRVVDKDDAFTRTAEEGGVREAVTAILLERMATRYPAAAAGNPSQLYTACEVTDTLASSRRACAFMGAYHERLTTSPSNFTSLLDQRPSIPLPEDPSRPLLDLRPLPDIINRPRSDQEIPTYYWLYRGVLNLYRYSYFQYDGEVLKNPLGRGWGSARVFYLEERDDPDPRFHHVPMALTMTRGKHMVVLLRGTMSGTEWGYDFDYKYAEELDTLGYFPGRVHAGFFRVFQELYPDILHEVLKQRPSHLLVAGHSLGGSVGALLGCYLRMASGVPTDVVGLGSLLTGDATFMDHLRSRVNARFIVFLGRGWETPVRAPTSTRLFTVGDALVQFTCGPFPGCPELGTGPSEATYQYALFPGMVPFYAEDLPNTDSWLKAEDVFATGAHQVIASHVCSYSCWLAWSVGDPNDRCLFIYDIDPTVPLSHRCIITSSSSDED